MEKSLQAKRNPVDVAFRTIVLTILIIYTVSILLVVLWGFITSFKSQYDLEGNALGFPEIWPGANKIIVEKYEHCLRFGNYVDIFKHFSYKKAIAYYPLFATAPVQISTEVDFFGMLGNTLFMAGLASAVQVLVTYSTAYVTAKYNFKFSGFIYAMVITIMTIPTIGTTPATIDILQKLNLYGRHIGIICMRACFGGMYYLVFYAFFEGLPDSYIEAAEIDGASQIDIFIRIILPLGFNMIGTVTLLLFVANWNDYSMSFVFMPTVPTLAFGIYSLVHNNAEHNGLEKSAPLQMAGCFLLITPILTLFVFLKDKLMGNISAGGLKG